MIKPKPIFKQALILLLAVVVVNPALAERLILRNGKVINGRILRQSRTYVIIRTPNGTRSYRKSQIRRILYGPSQAAAAARARKRQEALRKRRAAARKKRQERARKIQEQRKQRAEAARKRRAERRKALIQKRKLAEERKRQAAADLKRKADELRKKHLERRQAREARRKKAIAALVRKKAEVKRKVEARKKAATAGKKVGRKDPARQNRRVVAKDTPLRALMYSAMIPGWGQYRSGRTGSAAAYAGLTGGALYATYNANRTYRAALRNLEQSADIFSPTNITLQALGVSVVPSVAQSQDLLTASLYARPFQEQREAVDRRYGDYRNAALGFGAFYLFNLADAFFFHPSRGQGTVSTTPLGAVFSSAMLPGLGQWKSGRRGSSFLVGGLFAGALAMTHTARRQHRNAQRDYENLYNPYSTGSLLLGAAGLPTGTPTAAELSNPATAYAYDQLFAEQRGVVKRAYKRYALGTYALGAIYLWGLADAYFFHPARSGRSRRTASADHGPEFSFSLMPMTEDGQPGTTAHISMRMSF